MNDQNNALSHDGITLTTDQNKSTYDQDSVPAQISSGHSAEGGDINKSADILISDEVAKKNEEIEDNLTSEERKAEAVLRVQVQEMCMEPPSIFKSPIERLNSEWQSSEDTMEYCGRVISSCISSTNQSFYENKLPILALTKLILGSIYIHDCPANPRIPEYLIVSGCVGIILPLIPVLFKYLPVLTQETIQRNKRFWHWMKSPIYCFVYILSLAGYIWVYSAYKPEYVDTHASNYCYRGMYLFIFWLFNISFIVLFIFIIVITVMAVVVYRKNQASYGVTSNGEENEENNATG